MYFFPKQIIQFAVNLLQMLIKEGSSYLKSSCTLET